MTLPILPFQRWAGVLGRGRGRWFLALAVALGLVWALQVRPTPTERWLAEQRARGEKFTWEELGASRHSRFDPLVEELALALPPMAGLDTGFLPRQAVWPDERFDPFRIVLWNEPWLSRRDRKAQDWAAPTAEADALRPVIEALHGILQDLRPDPGVCDGGVRPAPYDLAVMAERLHTLVLLELHRSNLPQAHTNLVCLIRLGLARKDRSTMPSPSHPLQLAIEAAWQALQAPGWTPEQLAEWQADFEQLQIIPYLPRISEGARVLTDTAWLALVNRTSREFVDPYYSRSGNGMPPRWIAESLFTGWRSFRSSRDRLRLLQAHQLDIEVHRELARGAPYHPSRLGVSMEADFVGGLVVKLNPSLRVFFRPCSFWSVPPTGVTEAVLALDAQRRVAITAIALARYHLQHGHPADTLEQLVPEFLTTVPRDAWTGAALQYRQGRDGGRLLYSLGANGRDDTLRPDGSWRTNLERGDDLASLWRQPLLRVSHPPVPPDWAIALRESLSRQGASIPEPSSIVIEVVAFEDAPLELVLGTLIQQSGIALSRDPRLVLANYPNVSVRLENVTAFDALRAIVQNYELRLQQDAMTGGWRLGAP